MNGVWRLGWVGFSDGFFCLLFWLFIWLALMDLMGDNTLSLGELSLRVNGFGALLMFELTEEEREMRGMDDKRGGREEGDGRKGDDGGNDREVVN
jgi:hypothetical protein